MLNIAYYESKFVSLVSRKSKNQNFKNINSKVNWLYIQTIFTTFRIIKTEKLSKIIFFVYYSHLLLILNRIFLLKFKLVFVIKLIKILIQTLLYSMK